jgi:hypothetical protein
MLLEIEGKSFAKRFIKRQLATLISAGAIRDVVSAAP